MNSLFAIQPYEHADIWCFDDPARGLKCEPFVGRVNDFIDAILSHKGIFGDNGFRLLFSADPFPGIDTVLHHLREDPNGGNWYECDALGGEGWLCPALFKYFDNAPKEIYVRAEAIGS